MPGVDPLTFATDFAGLTAGVDTAAVDTAAVGTGAVGAPLTSTEPELAPYAR